MTVLAKNLKRLRLVKKLTQEQAAEAFGVSPQSVSRWECGNTLPDVMLLPKIAETYCVSIDDLYRETSTAYDNYAQRLGSIYEATLEPADFVRADQEYKKLLSSGDYSMEDLRLYGILHHHMMDYCIRQAGVYFDRAIDRGEEEDPETYWRTRRQKIYFLHQIGRVGECIGEFEKLVAEGSRDENHWDCLMLALSFADETERAWEVFRQAEAIFPESAQLCCVGGDLCRDRKDYEQAFRYWDRTLELDPEFCDARYSKGFCLEEMGRYREAYAEWTALADSLAQRGFDAEVQYPRELAKKCRGKLEIT